MVMKKVFGVMFAMFLLIVWPGAAVWTSIFPHILGGGIAESYLYPIYGGIILLAGLIVGCTVVILDELKSPKEKEKNTEDTDSDKE